ncbi:MAG: DUF4080 domain-containing protein [Deltaproteobacteria bacterium]|nr:DUF4080 domain-containing protein [Deltaproteobacteria bacterium]
MAPLLPGDSIGLVTLNARYVHMSPAIRYLRNQSRAAGFANTWIQEFTIQTPPWKMAQSILARQPKLVGFSMYIWNRQITLALMELLKKLRPDLLLVAGGPEVSYGPPPPYVDLVLAGEGEAKWVELLGHLSAGGELPPEFIQRAGRAGSGGSPSAAIPQTGSHPTASPLPLLMPYTEEDIEGLPHRLIYVETSRGCPFQCSFCLSALDETVVFFPEETVKTHIEWLINHGARRIKFLDRTFNARKQRALDFFRWLSGFKGVQFHFEIVGDLLDDPLAGFLDGVEPGMFQFEIGIQSADPQTQRQVRRRQNKDRLFGVIHRLRLAGKVHLHADLIWGLPGEDLPRLKESFRQVFDLRPHELQLGFLKFLPGAPIREDAHRYGYRFQDGPPYEFICHDRLSAAEVLELKRFEEVFDLYYNSGKFRFTLERLFELSPPWDVFSRLGDFFLARGLFPVSHSLDHLYEYLFQAVTISPMGEHLSREELTDWLKLDYCYHRRVLRLPRFLQGAAPPPILQAPPPPAPPTGTVQALIPFHHELAWEGDTPRLNPAPDTRWVLFGYPPQDQGYFFKPRMAPWPPKQGGLSAHRQT